MQRAACFSGNSEHKIFAVRVIVAFRLARRLG